MPVVAHDAYTNEPGEGPFVIFPTHAHQILSNCIHIIGVSIISFCFARRTESEQFGTRQWWASLTWARLLVVLLFLDSWIFLAFSGILVNGVGLSLSVPVCSLGIYACIIFYAGSKALIYLFLVERVWIVWSAGNTLTRFQSRIYKVCALVVLGFLIIFVDMIIGRVAQIRDDGVCIIGLRSFATIPLLSYDLFVNIFLTAMFLWALNREQNVSQRLRRLGRRTLLAAIVALTTSFINIIVLATLDGKQLGWVCLASCAADVTINALVLFWVTAGGHRVSSNKNTLTLPTLHVPVSFVRDRSQRTETDPDHLGHSSLKDLEDATAAKSMSLRRSSLRGSEIVFCSSPYPHRHHFSCDYDANAHHYSHSSPSTSPISTKGGVFFSTRVHNRDEALVGEFVEEDEWDIIDSSLGHNSLKEVPDAEIWRMPTLTNNSPMHLHPPSGVDSEPESPAYSVTTDTMHGSYAHLILSQPFASLNQNRLSQYTPTIHAIPPPLSVPAAALTKDALLTTPSGVTSALLPTSHLPYAIASPPSLPSSADVTPPSLPRKQSRKKLQRPQRPRSASSPPSTAMSRETAFSGETGESSTLVCHSTCAAAYAPYGAPASYYPEDEAYNRWKKGEGSSTGARRALRPLGAPRRTNTLPTFGSDYHHYPYPYPRPPYGHRHSSSSHGTNSTASNGRGKSRSGIWRSFSAALGLGKARSRGWVLGAEEDAQVGGHEGHGRDGPGAGLAAAATASRVEVTVTTRTTVDVVDRRAQRDVEDDIVEEGGEDEDRDRRAVRRTRSDLGGGQHASRSILLKGNPPPLPASTPSSLRISSRPHRPRAPPNFVVGERDDREQGQRHGKGDAEDESGEEPASRLASPPLPPPFPPLPANNFMHDPSQRSGINYSRPSRSDDGYSAHSKPDCAAKTNITMTTERESDADLDDSVAISAAAVAGDSVASHDIYPNTPCVTNISPPASPPHRNLSLSLPPSPERPVLPHLVIEPNARTRIQTRNPLPPS